MTDPVLPSWESDPLSTFLSDAQRNERVSSLKMPDLYALLRGVHAAFQQVATITEMEHNEHLLLARFLMARTHSAWLAAVRLGLSAQTVEAYPVARVVVENAWYALHIAKDPSAPARARIWLNRDDDPAAEARCAAEFSIKNVRATHAVLDPTNETACHTVYKTTIGLGGHPNQRGVLAAMIRTESGGFHTFGAVFLTDNPALIAAALKTAVEAAVGALKTFHLIFPERFQIMGIDRDVENLVGGLNAVLKQFAA
jgi:hypothetical protein